MNLDNLTGLTVGKVLQVSGITSLGYSNPNAVAITQTYATTTSTVPTVTAATPAAATAAALTVVDGAGTNNASIAAITDNASTIAAVQELADQINKLIVDAASLRTQLTAANADILANRKLINQLVDILQAAGIAG